MDNIIDFLNFQINVNFDARNALAGLYLWLLFGYLSSMVSCDMQRWMSDNLLFRHFVGIISFFFLFTILTPNNKSPVLDIWIKTIFVYFIFILMVKSKWYFSLPVFLILIVDQSLQAQINYITGQNESDPQIKTLTSVRNGLYIAALVLIVIGFIHYFFRQLSEFEKEFSIIKLLFAHNCQKSDEIVFPE